MMGWLCMHAIAADMPQQQLQGGDLLPAAHPPCRSLVADCCLQGAV
jgi:hypothetical protein